MSHCAFVTPFVFQPQFLVPLVAGAAVGVAVGTAASVVLESRRRARAGVAFRANLLGVLEDLNAQGIHVESTELGADIMLELDCDDGTTIKVKKLADGQYQLIGPHGGELQQTLMQQYTYMAAKSDLTSEGFNVIGEDVDEQGAIKLLARRWGAEKEEVETLIPAQGPIRIQGFGMPPHKCADTIERLALRLGRVEERQYDTEEALQVLRLFPVSG